MNTMHNDNGIIIALATPNGRSAVAIIRMSGKGCIELVRPFLSCALEVGKLKVNKFNGKTFDERLMAVCYKAPKSYTGEDIVELYPHGNPTICDMIIKTLIGAGARVAERGEFTKRAFLNGKVDLMQCEALADIIDAQTAEQLNYGNKRYDGGFKSLFDVENILKDALSRVEAVLHYGDELEGEDVDEGIDEDVFNGIDRAIEMLSAEIKGYAGGKIIKDGFKVALIGEPNVGKSTLLNALIGSERAIVTPIAGTTRDIIDGEYIYNDRKFIIIDTAGIKDNTDDEVEKIGIDRAKQAAEGADGVLYIVNDGKTETEQKTGERFAVVWNKCDDITDVGTEYDRATEGEKLKISAKHGKNITALKQRLYDMCPKDFGSICNHRQYDCVVKCLDSLKSAKSEAKSAGGLEIVAALLYEAYSAMTELYGEKADEKVISAVFDRFCVGK